jgi:hypothetical protein
LAPAVVVLGDLVAVLPQAGDQAVGHVGDGERGEGVDDHQLHGFTPDAVMQ